MHVAEKYQFYSVQIFNLFFLLIRHRIFFKTEELSFFKKEIF